jgi:hypothetical protein
MSVKKVVSGNGGVNATIVFKAEPNGSLLEILGLEIYPEYNKKNTLYSNRGSPLDFRGLSASQPASVMAKIDIADFDAGAIHVLDLTVNG